MCWTCWRWYGPSTCARFMADAGDESVEVSVLVLTYNHEPYIAECLDSVLDQDFDGRWEILVGEDCSTDGTAAVVQSYVERFPGRVRLVTSQHNVGMHANFRRLLACSNGRFVAVCEGDDYWHAPEKLRLQVEVLSMHPMCTGVHSDVDLLEPRDGACTRIPHFWAGVVPDQKPFTVYEDLLIRNTVQTCTVLVRGEAARSYPQSVLAQGMYVVEDWPFFLHVTSGGPMVRMPQSLATYRVVDGSATRQGDLANERRVIDQFRLINDASRGNPAWAAPRGIGLTRTLEVLLLTALDKGDRQMALRALAAGAAAGAPRDWKSLATAAAVRIPGGWWMARAVVRVLRSFRKVMRRRR